MPPAQYCGCSIFSKTAPVTPRYPAISRGLSRALTMPHWGIAAGRRELFSSPLVHRMTIPEKLQ